MCRKWRKTLGEQSLQHVQRRVSVNRHERKRQRAGVASGQGLMLDGKNTRLGCDGSDVLRP